jgi:hypothetical protein
MTSLTAHYMDDKCGKQNHDKTKQIKSIFLMAHIFIFNDPSFYSHTLA